MNSRQSIYISNGRIISLASMQKDHPLHLQDGGFEDPVALFVTVMMPEKIPLAKVYFVGVYPNKRDFYILFPDEK